MAKQMTVDEFWNNVFSGNFIADMPYDMCFNISGHNGPIDHPRYFVSQIQCRICEHKQFSAWPHGTDENFLECENCGHLTSEPIAREVYVIDVDREGFCTYGKA